MMVDGLRSGDHEAWPWKTEFVIVSPRLRGCATADCEVRERKQEIDEATETPRVERDDNVI